MKPLLIRTSPHLYAPIKVGRYTLSIQASKLHQCTPRETFIFSSQYTHFECTIRFDGKFIDPRDRPELKDFGWTQYWESNNDFPGDNVPKEALEKILDNLLDLK